jgi:hypothetical protein
METITESYLQDIICSINSNLNTHPTKELKLAIRNGMYGVYVYVDMSIDCILKMYKTKKELFIYLEGMHRALNLL